jgi:tetratricopeptide (TPR) repeat protein
MAQPTPSRKNFSVRLPDSLYGRLEALGQRTGESMNKLIGTAVAMLVNAPELAPTAVANDINAQIARDAVRQGPEAIGPLKGIAKHAHNRDQVALASVLWAAAARLVAEVDGPERASQDLSHTAVVADSSGRHELAVALFEEALRLDPNNLEAANRLGQRLHHLAHQHDDDVERYRQAERHLARVTFVDSYAKLFHGWAALYVARADHDPYMEDRAVGEIDEALKAWAFSDRGGKDRTSWVRHLKRLEGMGLHERVLGLIDFAARNARWQQVTLADVAASVIESDSASSSTAAESSISE